MNKALADAAIAGLTADWAADCDTEDGSWCARFFRECVTQVYGARFADLFERATKTAVGYGCAFRNAGYAATGGRAVGDALFKLSGSKGFGHVGILTPGDLVAEASIVHGGRGTRSLAAFGRWDLTIRLPNLAPAQPRLVIVAGNPLWYKPVRAAYDPAGRFDVDTADLCRLFGAAPLLQPTLPIREALAALGLTARFNPEHMGDETDPRMYALVTRSER